MGDFSCFKQKFMGAYSNIKFPNDDSIKLLTHMVIMCISSEFIV